MQRAILAAELMLHVDAGDLRADQRRILVQLRPREGIDDAEALTEAMLYFHQERVISIRAQWDTILVDHPQQRIAGQQAVYRGGLAGADRPAVDSGQLEERIRYQHVPEQRVQRPAGRVELRPI